MELSILEEAILYSALGHYIEYCRSCLENPENEAQFTFIKGEISTIESLTEKVKRDFISHGGDASLLH